MLTKAELAEIKTWNESRGNRHVFALLARVEELEAALRECYACIEDGKPGDALDVIDKLFPYTGPTPSWVTENKNANP